ncbi:hypothetical protein GCM10011363_22570 [Marivita lacus]|uniref:Uncharacterized protein n=1 Tax=Marivita lacus TaxID=1323742 RepID=A0ABQ1KNU6_9RHOB|nr:hypothetical protein GCM10011363_22570 [Marivita lacus]
MLRLYWKTGTFHRATIRTNMQTNFDMVVVSKQVDVSGIEPFVAA